MKTIGFKTHSFEGDGKKDSWDWTFINSQPNLVEIEVGLAELDKEDLSDVFGRKEESAILLEVHVHVRDQHRIYNDEFFKVKPLKGDSIANTSFLTFNAHSEKIKLKFLRKYCSHLGFSTLVQVNEIIRDKFIDMQVLTMKSKGKEVLVEELWENEYRE